MTNPVKELTYTKKTKEEILTRAEKKQRRERRKSIRRLIDLSKLQYVCNASIKDLFKELNGTIIGKEGEQHAFKDNGAKILAVAHLDTVQQKTTFAVKKYIDCTAIYSPRLDDRLGVYTILYLLPKLGITTDILLCENEEKGKSTATDFKTDKKYNWIVEFDRNGDDVVSYMYKIDKILEEFFTVGIGSYTDISVLQHLKAKAFNVGVGYHREHSEDAFFIMGQYLSQIEKFIRFYSKYNETVFEHTEEQHNYSRYVRKREYYNWGYYGNSCHNSSYNFEHEEEETAEEAYTRRIHEGVDEDRALQLYAEEIGFDNAVGFGAKEKENNKPPKRKEWVASDGRMWCIRCKCYSKMYIDGGGFLRCVECNTPGYEGQNKSDVSSGFLGGDGIYE